MAQGVAVPVVRLAMLGEALVLPVALGLGVMLVLTLGEALVEGVRVGTRLTVHPAPAPARPGLPEPAAVTLGEGEMAVEGEVLPLAGALALALMQRVVRALIVVRPEGIMERGAVALPEKLALVLGERVALGLALSLTLPVLLLEPDSLEQGEMVREAEAHFEALGLGETESVGRARVGVRVAFAEAVGPPLPALPRPAGVPQEVGVALLVREPAPPPLAEGEGEADTLTLGDRLSLALALEVTEALGLLAWARENGPPPPADALALLLADTVLVALRVVLRRGVAVALAAVRVARGAEGEALAHTLEEAESEKLGERRGEAEALGLPEGRGVALEEPVGVPPVAQRLGLAEGLVVLLPDWLRVMEGLPESL